MKYTIKDFLEMKSKKLIDAQQLEILKKISKCGKKGLTNNELSRLLGWTVDRVKPRVYELVNEGILKDLGSRKDMYTKRYNSVWGLA